MRTSQTLPGSHHHTLWLVLSSYLFPVQPEAGICTAAACDFFFFTLLLLHFESDSNLNDNLSPSEIEWATSERLCANNDHLQAAMAQLRRGQKELCQRGENERGEEKVRVEKRAFKGLENDKEVEWGGGGDNATGGTKKRREAMNRNWVCFDFRDFSGGNSWWELTGVGDRRFGTVHWWFPSTTPHENQRIRPHITK